MATPAHSVTRLLHLWGNGDREALSELTPLVYAELRRLAARSLRQERLDHTLESTALVHEAFLRLVDQKDVQWQNRSQFFALASELIRRILVDYARARKTAKRGGGQLMLALDDALAKPQERSLDLVRLDESLEALSQIDPRQGKIIELRYFGGLTIEETAAVLDVSPATVKREWTMAKAWLKREMTRPSAV